MVEPKQVLWEFFSELELSYIWMRLKTNAPALIHYSHDKGAGVCANTQKDETALVAFLQTGGI